MLVIKVWRLPTQKEEKLKELNKVIVTAIVEIPALKRIDQNDIVILFPCDYGSGEEIIIEISSTQDHMGWIREYIAQEVGKAVWALYPKTKIGCFVYAQDPDIMKSWSSTNH